MDVEAHRPWRGATATQRTNEMIVALRSGDGPAAARVAQEVVFAAVMDQDEEATAQALAMLSSLTGYVVGLLGGFEAAGFDADSLLRRVGLDDAGHAQS